MLVEAEHFARLALEAIAVDGARRDLSARHQTQPGMAEVIGLSGNDEIFPADTAITGKNGDELCGLPQPVCLGQGVCGNRRQTPSRVRPLARRARITALPPRVLMRTRKPCVRLRLTTEG